MGSNPIVRNLFLPFYTFTFFFCHIMARDILDTIRVLTAINNTIIMIGIVIIYYYSPTPPATTFMLLKYWIVNLGLLLFGGYLLFVFIYTFYPGNGGSGLVLFTWSDLE
jgi:hypothetical protein